VAARLKRRIAVPDFTACMPDKSLNQRLRDKESLAQVVIDRLTLRL
jgi:hypothetical protein